MLLVAALLGGALACDAQAGATDPERDILVTFDNTGADAGSAGASPPYRFRKRYAVSGTVQRLSRAVERDYDLDRVDHWPIRSLSVYCFVYRVPEGQDRDALIAALSSDARVESVQLLQRFETRLDDLAGYNDPYVGLQHGLRELGVIEAHRAALGEGIRVAIIDSHVDVRHEDLRGRIRSFEVFADRSSAIDEEHGTAVASIIGANANNAVGIVGVAPAAMLDVLVSCWIEAHGTVCDSFTLAKALDFLLRDPPHIVNLSLTGPDDRLVGRLLEKVLDAGVIVVAADAAEDIDGESFPASLPGVIAIGQARRGAEGELIAPGEQILVALPQDQYDMRSGSSLSAAHASGVLALLLSVAPQETGDSLRSILQRSQVGDSPHSIDACAALQLAGAMGCRPRRAVKTE
jgi:subtilisin family serine protease